MRADLPASASGETNRTRKDARNGDGGEPLSQARVRCKVWVEQKSEVLLSEWRVELLEAVEETGSLAGAAAKLDVPYRTAWQKLKRTEEALSLRLLETESGGSEGGGSRLTAEARELVRRFRRVTAGVADLVEERFRAEFSDPS